MHQVLHTFLSLRLHDVDSTVAAAGSNITTDSGRKAKSKEEKRKKLRQKMTKKQKKVNVK